MLNTRYSVEVIIIWKTKRIIIKMDNENGYKSSPSISMHEFLDFLKISCQLQESIDHRSDDTRIDYSDLAKNSLVNTLVNVKSTPSPRTDSGENTNGKSVN